MRVSPATAAWSWATRTAVKAASRPPHQRSRSPSTRGASSRCRSQERACSAASGPSDDRELYCRVVNVVRPRLRQVVLDSTDARRSAEFWRRLLGLRYRPGHEPPADGADDAAG